MNSNATRNAVFQTQTPTRIPSENQIYSLNNRVSAVRINDAVSTWTASLEVRFNKLTSLQRGWDGYAGIPVSFSCARFAANLVERLYDPAVPPPKLVPGSDGTLQIEWHRNQYDLEIEVAGPYKVVATRRDLRTEHVEEVELDRDYSKLAEWISELGTHRRPLNGMGVTNP